MNDDVLRGELIETALAAELHNVARLAPEFHSVGNRRRAEMAAWIVHRLVHDAAAGDPRAIAFWRHRKRPPRPPAPTTDKPRIALFSPGLRMGGAERWIVDLAKHLDRNRVHVAGIGIRNWDCDGPLLAKATQTTAVMLGEEACGQLAVYEYSDFLPFDRASWRYRHWFKRAFCPGHQGCRHLASFSPTSFLNWDPYRDLTRKNKYTASGSTILHKQSIPKTPNPVSRHARRRRLKARRILLERFGDRVDTKIDPQPEFLGKAFHCLVSVHIPGSWKHLLDRGQHQLMGLGVCTVSREIWTCCLDERPQAWLHYVPIRDDFSDVAEKVAWCDTHRDECRRIGQRAKAFFETDSTLKVIGQYLIRRLERHHAEASD